MKTDNEEKEDRNGPSQQEMRAREMHRQVASEHSMQETEPQDSSTCDLKTRIRLLQSKLHPSSVVCTPEASQKEHQGANGYSIQRSDSCESHERDADSLSISSTSYSSSSSSSLAPTPPPRLSSLQSFRQQQRPLPARPKVPEVSSSNREVSMSQGYPQASTDKLTPTQQQGQLTANHNNWPNGPEPSRFVLHDQQQRHLNGLFNNSHQDMLLRTTNMIVGQQKQQQQQLQLSQQLRNNSMKPARIGAISPPTNLAASVSHKKILLQQQQHQVCPANQSMHQQHQPRLLSNPYKTSINYLQNCGQIQRNNYSPQTICYNHHGKIVQPNVSPSSLPTLPDESSQLSQFVGPNQLGSRAPITKAVQEMISQQQQQLHQTYVINTPSSRQPICGFHPNQMSATMGAQPPNWAQQNSHKLSSSSWSSTSSLSSSTSSSKLAQNGLPNLQADANQPAISIASRNLLVDERIAKPATVPSKISPDSVQLLVTGSRHHHHHHHQQQQQQQQHRDGLNNDLLMMQEQPLRQQQAATSEQNKPTLSPIVQARANENNDIHTLNHMNHNDHTSRVPVQGRPEIIANLDELTKSEQATLAATPPDSSSSSALQRVDSSFSSDHQSSMAENPFKRCPNSRQGISSQTQTPALDSVSASTSTQIQTSTTTTTTTTTQAQAQAQPQAQAQAQAQPQHQPQPQPQHQPQPPALTPAQNSQAAAPPASPAGRWMTADERHRQRQVELVALMRLRQQQQMSSQELPTLQQLQQQIQQQQQQQQQQHHHHNQPQQLAHLSQQQHSTHQWTSDVAAVMLQQRQQQHHHWRTHTNTAGHSNAGSLDMEIDQTRPANSPLSSPHSTRPQVSSSSPNQQNSPLPESQYANKLATSTSDVHHDDGQNTDRPQTVQQSLLTTADCKLPNGTVNSSNNLTRDPVPIPRGIQQTSTLDFQNTQSIQEELSILTNSSCIINPRLKDISESAQSTPLNSIMSDSTTLSTDTPLSSIELIPKLIERLDRKLTVMKGEQLTLIREIELNENLGRRLFETMKRHLTVNEFEKVALHSNEIEKVTKLILSLKLRLKKVEKELKELNANNQRLKSANSSPGQQSQNTSQTNQSQMSKTTSLKAQLEESNSIKTVLLPTVRGISDPTGTNGLPKRNHQHHASLQSSAGDNNMSVGCLFAVPAERAPSIATNKLARQHHQMSDLTDSGCDSRSSRLCSPRNASDHHEIASPSAVASSKTSDQDGGPKTASTSSDSIFNSTDSALGSTITCHGGSVSNIEQPATSQSSLSSSSETSTSNRSHHHPSNSPSQSHLSSNISVSSHSSISSVPNSPPLVSPAGISNAISSTPKSSSKGSNMSAKSNSNSSRTNNDLSVFFTSSKSDGNNNNNNNSSNNDSALYSSRNLDDTTLTLTDIDILVAKRNKLLSQLEEAHQLEDCIVHRNDTIVYRILKKYFSEGVQGGEIAEFKQFTRLKSLLLKDTHHVAERIENAELQLIELKQTNQANL